MGRGAGVTIDFNANLARFTGSVDKATNDLTRFQSNSERTSKNINRSFSKIGDGLAGVRAKMLSLNGVLAGLGAGVGVGQVVKIADTYKLLEGRLVLVTAGSEQLAKVQNELFKISQDSRSSYEGTLTLFARMARATRELNVTDEERLKVTEAINKSMIVSGATAHEATAAIIQLSQALASGELRGEELRSVMEQTPRLSEAIADGLGVTIGELRKLSREGKLTSEVVFGALLGQAEKINKEFSRMGKTVGQAIIVVNNSIGKLIAGADKAGSATDVLAENIIALSVLIDNWAEANQGLIAQKIPEYVDRIGKSLSTINTLYQSLPEGAASGIVGAFLFGPKAGAIIGLSDAVDLLDALANSVAGFQAAKSGEISWLEYATSDAEELEAVLDRLDIKKKILGSGASGSWADFEGGASGSWGEKDTAESPSISTRALTVAREYTEEEVEKIDNALESAFRSVDKFALKIKEANVFNALTDAFLDVDIASTLDDVTADLNDFFGDLDRLTKEVKVDNALTDFFTEIDKKSEETFGDKMQSALEGWGDSFSATLNDMLWGAEATFGDILKSFAMMMTQMAIQKLVGGLITSGLGATVTASADGNVFSGAGISAYSGTVVSKPTVFPFANGIGLMGEAGAEAILPLKRGSDGKLGVQAEGGGGTVINVKLQMPQGYKGGSGERATALQYGKLVGAGIRRAQRNA